MGALTTSAVGITALGAGTLAYATLYEARAYRLREAEIACLPPASPALTVLHLSDLHMLPSQRGKVAWLQDLASHQPDLVVNTGDNLSHPDAVATVVSGLGALLDVPGVYVFGSNDYWGPVLKNPLRYFLPNGGKKRITGPPLPWRELRREFDAAGWVDLSNRRATLDVRGLTLAFAGVDDPHLRYDDLAAVSGPGDPTAALRVGVTHAPYLRVLDQFTADGYDVIFAGHTHGGQLRVPGYGALVTNCDLDTKRSRGLHAHEAGGRRAQLHVSAGLGTSPYAPYRIACHPEATLLRLTPTS